MLLILSSGAAEGAQTPATTVSDYAAIRRRVESMTPGSGPPGTEVTLRSTRLPAITPMRIGIGATHFGFEEIGQVLSTERGEISVTVVVPEWATSEVSYRMIVFDFYFAPLALTEVFHVTAPDGTVGREGVLTEDGVECPAMRGDDQMLYTLTGDLAGYRSGDRVRIRGRIAETSMCMQGTTLEVVEIRAGS